MLVAALLEPLAGCFALMRLHFSIVHLSARLGLFSLRVRRHELASVKTLASKKQKVSAELALLVDTRKPH